MDPTQTIGKRASGGGGNVAALAGAVLVTWTTPCFLRLAQAAQSANAPEAPSPWLEWLLVFAFAGLCCGIAFKDPKRSHQN